MATVMIVTTMMLPRLVKSRAASWSQGGPKGSPGLDRVAKGDNDTPVERHGFSSHNLLGDEAKSQEARNAAVKTEMSAAFWCNFNSCRIRSAIARLFSPSNYPRLQDLPSLARDLLFRTQSPTRQFTVKRKPCRARNSALSPRQNGATRVEDIRRETA